jgi:hypothetical protein
MRIKLGNFMAVEDDSDKICSTVVAEDMEKWLTKARCNVGEPTMFYTQRQINLFTPYKAKAATLLKLSKRKYYCYPCADHLLQEHNA